MSYDGQERRKGDMIQEERDLLIRIDTNLTNMTHTMDAHILTDASSFKEINNKIGWLQKIVFMGLGALALMKLFLK